MYLQDYFWFLGAILLCMIFSIYANYRVRSSFNKYNLVPNHSGTTGCDAAVRLLAAENVRGISIGTVKGALTDHYNPTRNIVNLSEATYNGNSIAAVAVAAHEIGHVMQKTHGYLLYKIRSAIVPVVNFGTFLAMPLVIIGFLLNLFVETLNPDIGFYIALAGVVLYGGSLLFALVTLPVEFNASKRAKKMLVSQGILTKDEERGAEGVLSAAALTYLASLLSSLVYFLRFFVYVLTLFGRRNSRR